MKAKAITTRETFQTAQTAPDDDVASPPQSGWFSLLKPLGGYLAVFTITFSVLLAVPYVFVDDYPALYAAMRGDLTSEVNARLYGGRPVLAFLFESVFSLVHSLGGMRIARLVGIISVAILAWLLFLALSRVKVQRPVALMIPIMICTLPTFQVYVSWSIASVALVSFILGGLGLFAAEAACQRLYGWRQTPDRLRVGLAAAGYGVAAIVLLLAGLATDQATGLFYWVFAAIFMLAADRRVPELALRGVVYLVVAGIAMGLEFLVVQALARLSGSFFARDALVKAADLPAKISWFFDTVLYSSLNLWVLEPRHSIEVAVSMLIIVGLLLYLRGNIWERLFKLGIALALLPLSYLANLAVAENWASYRSLAAISSLVALYAGLAVVGIIRTMVGNATRAQAITNTVLAVTCMFACFGAATAVAVEFAIPSYLEYNLAVQQLRNQSLVGKQEVYFIQPTWQEDAAPFVRYDEFGYPSSVAPWVPAPMTYVALSQVDPAYENLPVVIAKVNPDGSNPPPPPDSLVINMHHLADVNRMTMCFAGFGYCRP